MSKLKNEVIGKRIRQTRNDLGFSQEELAAGVGMTRSQISNIETGRTELSLKDAVSICDFLGLDLQELTNVDDNELESTILFRYGGSDDAEDHAELIDWSENVIKELIAQEELYQKERRGRTNADV